MEEGPTSITHEEEVLFERTPLVAGDPDLAAAGVVHVHRQPTDRLVVTGGNGRGAVEGRDFEFGPGLRIAGIDGEVGCAAAQRQLVLGGGHHSVKAALPYQVEFARASN